MDTPTVGTETPTGGVAVPTVGDVSRPCPTVGDVGRLSLTVGCVGAPPILGGTAHKAVGGVGGTTAVVRRATLSLYVVDKLCWHQTYSSAGSTMLASDLQLS